MSEYDALEGYSLKIHGDRWEQQLWPLVSGAFSNYEVFWRRYIVPLTNRINPAIRSDLPEWIRLRPEISDTLEWMTMCHYSVFYYLARAKARMLGDTSPLFLEEIFALLDTCRDNVVHFFKSVPEIFGDFGRPAPQLPTQGAFLCSREDRVKPKPERGGFVRAKEYRDVMIHNPVLGRSMNKTAEALPHWTVLARVKRSWRAAESLEPSNWISCHDLFESLYQDITGFLQEEWQSIIDAMEELRHKPQYAVKFKTKWALHGLVPTGDLKVRMRLRPVASAIVTSSNTSYSSTGVVIRQLTSIPLAPPDSEIRAAGSNEKPNESK